MKDVKAPSWEKGFRQSSSSPEKRKNSKYTQKKRKDSSYMDLLRKLLIFDFQVEVCVESGRPHSEPSIFFFDHTVSTYKAMSRLGYGIADKKKQGGSCWP